MGKGCGGCLEVSHQATNVVDAAVTWDKVAWQCCREVVLPVIPLVLLGSLRSLKYAVAYDSFPSVLWYNVHGLIVAS